METRPYELPFFKYGDLPEYPTSGRQFRLPPGQWVAGVPRRADVTDQAYLNMGYTHLNQNVGQVQPVDHIPASQEACCTNSDFLREAYPNSPVAEWSREMCRYAVDQFCDARNGGYAFFTHQMNEAYNINIPWRLESHLPQARWVMERFSERLAAISGRNYGDYGGYMSGSFFSGSNAAFEAALANDQAAVAYCRANPFQGNGFMANNGYLTHGAMIGGYYYGGTDFPTWFYGVLVQQAIDQMARRGVGTDQHVAMSLHSGFCQVMSPDEFTLPYRMSVPDAGGYMERFTFPLWSSGMGIGTYSLWLMQKYDMYSWEADFRVGTNPNLVLPDGGDGGLKYVGSGNPQRAQRGNFYNPADPQGTQVAYPTQPEGGQDILCVSCDMWSDAWQWAGSNNTFTGHRIGNGSMRTVDNYYPLRNFEGGTGVARIGWSGNRRWSWYMNPVLESGQWETVTLDLMGGSWTFEAEGRTPYLFKHTL